MKDQDGECSSFQVCRWCQVH